MNPSLCFIGTVGRGWAAPALPLLLLMGVGVLFLQQIYGWMGRGDLQRSDTVSAAGRQELTVCVPGEAELLAQMRTLKGKEKITAHDSCCVMLLTFSPCKLY